MHSQFKEKKKVKNKADRLKKNNTIRNFLKKKITVKIINLENGTYSNRKKNTFKACHQLLFLL